MKSAPDQDLQKAASAGFAETDSIFPAHYRFLK